MTRLLTAAALALLLCGCQTLPERVLVPVAVPCSVEMPLAPEWATLTLTDESSIWDQVRALLAERRQRIAYEEQLRVALDACRSLPTKTASLDL